MAARAAGEGREPGSRSWPGVEAAYITSGAAAGIAISVAACMAGTDHDKMLQLPDTRGMKDEVIVQASQIGGYDNMI